LFHFMKFHKIESTSKCVKCVDNKAVIPWVNWTQHKYSHCRWYSDGSSPWLWTKWRNGLYVSISSGWKLIKMMTIIQGTQLVGTMNCDADKMAEKFQNLMDDGDMWHWRRNSLLTWWKWVSQWTE
jgi:hypothetical protein